MKWYIKMAEEVYFEQTLQREIGNTHLMQH